jgi:hypothetical protein
MEGGCLEGWNQKSLAAFLRGMRRGFECNIDTSVDQGHFIVKRNLLISKLLAGYGYLFFGLCPTWF